jgi:hypothetical protein
MCKANVLEQDVLFCSDSEMSDYLKSKNVTNIEGYAKYALEQQPTPPSAERLSQQQQHYIKNEIKKYVSPEPLFYLVYWCLYG